MSALKYTTLTFRKVFSINSKRSVLRQLKVVIYSLRFVIEVKTRAEADIVKRYPLININFSNSTRPDVKTDTPVTFRSEVFKSIDNH